MMPLEINLISYGIPTDVLPIIMSSMLYC